EGSFDKGVRLEIPLDWIAGRPSRNSIRTTLRPVQRDGGARLNVDGRLYGVVRDYDAAGIDDRWGRVWR
ncbi:MAG: YjbH domain-containing protein, partial [Rhodobacteraceae bacterium]|nr:YjbH domain-containing protein [Paracoccaceae bacterium]